jgi:hypothetical protein
MAQCHDDTLPSKVRTQGSTFLTEGSRFELARAKFWLSHQDENLEPNLVPGPKNQNQVGPNLRFSPEVRSSNQGSSLNFGIPIEVLTK